MRREPFFAGIRLNTEDLDPESYPLSIPAVRQIPTLRFHPAVTYLTGENGAGKSTIIEALAIAAGFNAEGGRKSFRTESTDTDSRLARALVIGRGPDREQDGFFLRAESAYVLLTYLNENGLEGGYGGDLHQRSHGEAFMQIFQSRFAHIDNSLFILDEIESALSPQRQLEFLALMHYHIGRGSSFIVSTHSPILMSYPDSRLYWLDRDGMEERHWKDTDHFRIYEAFIRRSERMLDTILGES